MVCNLEESEDMALSLNSDDKSWIKSRTTESEERVKETISTELSKAIQNLQPQGWQRASASIVAFGSPVAICALIVAVLAVAFGALYQSFAHVKEETAFRTSTADDLKSIHNELNTVRALMSALQPLKKQNQDAARELLIQAKQKIIPPIPESAVKQAGDSFAEAGATNTDAWNVALEFVAYRSSQNINQLPYESLKPLPGEEGKNVTMLNPPMDGKPLPSITGYGTVPFKDGAKVIATGLGLKLNPTGYVSKHIFLTGGALLIDELEMHHVTLSNLEVYYHGGYLSLDDVTFSNCRFAINNTPNGQTLVEKILSDSVVTGDISAPTHN